MRCRAHSLVASAEGSQRRDHRDSHHRRCLRSSMAVVRIRGAHLIKKPTLSSQTFPSLSCQSNSPSHMLHTGGTCFTTRQSTNVSPRRHDYDVGVVNHRSLSPPSYVASIQTVPQPLMADQQARPYPFPTPFPKPQLPRSRRRGYQIHERARTPLSMLIGEFVGAAERALGRRLGSAGRRGCVRNLP